MRHVNSVYWGCKVVLKDFQYQPHFRPLNNRYPPMTKKEKIIDPSDFQSIKLLTSFQNTSTGLKEVPPEKCTLIEIGKKNLTLELPLHSCNMSHNVIIKISVAETGMKQREILAVTGKVIHMEVENYTRVVVDCIQFDEASWNELLQIYSKRQDSITNFLKSAKGY